MLGKASSGVHVDGLWSNKKVFSLAFTGSAWAIVVRKNLGIDAEDVGGT